MQTNCNCIFLICREQPSLLKQPKVAELENYKHVITPNDCIRKQSLTIGSHKKVSKWSRFSEEKYFKFIRFDDSIVYVLFNDFLNHCNTSLHELKMETWNILGFHTISRDTKANRHRSHVVARNKWKNQNSFVKSAPTWPLWRQVKIGNRLC